VLRVVGHEGDGVDRELIEARLVRVRVRVRVRELS
tara:strand:+ start:206 stop:310 length:105 start_codon:yes stop_codon:yes gene_type:complete